MSSKKALALNDPSAGHHSIPLGLPLWIRAVMLSLCLSVALIGCGLNEGNEDGDSKSGGEEESTLVLYSGRSESLVAPLIETFEEESGIEVQVRWGSSTEIAAHPHGRRRCFAGRSFLRPGSGQFGADRGPF